MAPPPMGHMKDRLLGPLKDGGCRKVRGQLVGTLGAVQWAGAWGP